MTTHKQIDKLCIAAAVLTVLAALLFMSAETLGITAAQRSLGYEERLFDSTRVHTIDIVMEDWDSFVQSCENEEYAVCTAVIDGESYRNIGIRAKGNTSLSSVSSMDSGRYSFKIEFDQYDSTQSYHGLDKLSLNNLIQDNTYMKDFLVYQMMGEFGAAAPLCSYVYITVNGQDWGLYLAVEGVEDSFLQRNYGSGYGELYKPDSLSMGGGRGNGMDFSMEDFDFSELQSEPESRLPEGFDPSSTGGDRGAMPDMGEMPEMSGQFDPSGRGQASPGGGFAGENFGGMGGFGGMGSSDVKLQYIDDDPDSYSNIFDSAKTDITAADQTRLIRSLKTLSEGADIASVVDIDAVIRYFVVHNFVVNADSYTGSMIHNYYLYEEDGLLSMLPWDYNLAFGTFQGSDTSSAVNESIDLSLSDRPMVSWIFDSEEYTQLYHEYFAQFIDEIFTSGWFDRLAAHTAALISPYVERDPSKFCAYEEFEAGVEAITQFCTLRAESVTAQLSGGDTLIDTGSLNLSDMGTMGMAAGGAGENRGDRFTQGGTAPDMGQMPGGMTTPGGQPANSTGQPSDPAITPPGPEAQEGAQPGLSFPFSGSGSFPAADAAAASGVGSSIILFCGSALLLLIGLLIAFKYKRR